MQRWPSIVAHADMDAFYPAVEQMDDSATARWSIRVLRLRSRHENELTREPELAEGTGPLRDGLKKSWHRVVPIVPPAWPRAPANRPRYA